MNYIEQINVFWSLDAEHLFNGNETRLYFYLLKLSNSLYWKNPLTNADGYTAAMVGISVNTLKTARNRLQQAGLVRFKPGGNGSRDKCIYEIIPAEKVIDKVSNSDTLSAETLTPYPQPNQRKADDINKHKQNQTSFTDANASVAAKNQPASELKKKKKKDSAPSSLYTACIAKYDDFIKLRTENGAKIDGAQGNAMKNIIAYLTTQVKKKNSNLTEEQIPEKVVESWAMILDNWHHLSDFLQGRLRLVDINSELVNILSQIRHGINNTKQGQAGNTGHTTGNAGKVRSKGGTVADLESLKFGGNSSSSQQSQFSNAEVVE